MDEQRRGPQIVPIQPNDVFLARINNGLDANSLDADEVIPIDSLIVIPNTTWPVGIPMTGCNLSQDEQDWLEGGIAEFNNSRYWHAHEDWEELWKSLKSRNVDLDYILGIQGLIQTTALMFQYERMKKRGCLSMWSKLTEKLGTPDEAKFDNLWSIDIPLLLREVSVFIDDADSEEPKWNLQCSSVQIHNVNE